MKPKVKKNSTSSNKIAKAPAPSKAHPRTPESPPPSPSCEEIKSKGGRKKGGKLVFVQSPGGSIKQKYECPDNVSSIKRLRRGAAIEGVDGTPEGTTTQGKWQHEQLEGVKVNLGQMVQRNAALETCSISYIEQLKAAYGAMEAQRNFIAAFLPGTNGSIPAPPALPQQPEWYTQLCTRKQAEASSAVTSLASLDYF